MVSLVVRRAMPDHERAGERTWWKVLIWAFASIYGGRLVSQIGSGRIVVSIVDILGSLTVAGMVALVWWVLRGRRT
jgi:hypothetical protein